MPRPTKDREIEALEALRKVADHDPERALDAFVDQIVSPQGRPAQSGGTAPKSRHPKPG